MKDFTQGNILKAIALFTLPLLVGNFFQLFYNIVDTLIVGQTLGKEALASVGATGPINILIVDAVQGMTAGLAILTAQRFGAKNKLGVKKSYVTGFFITICISLFVGIIGFILVGTLLKFMQTPPAIFEGAKDFMSVMLLGMIAPNLYAFLSNILRSLGDSRTPLTALVFSSIINVALEYLAILVFHLGIWGASLATVLAQAFSVLFLLIHIKRKVPDLKFDKSLIKPDRAQILEHMRLSIPMGIQTSIIAIGSITLQIALNTMGTNAVATATIGTRVEQLASLPLMSLGITMATFTAQNYGAKKYIRINQGLFKALGIGIIWSVFYAILLNIFSREFTMLFVSGNQKEIIDLTKHYYLVTSCFYWVLAILFVARSAIQGVGNAKIPMIAGFMELIMRGSIAIIGVMLFNTTLIFASNAAAWVGSVFVLIPTLIKMMKQFDAGNSIPQNNVSDVIHTN